jgi:hypothetical protein
MRSKLIVVFLSILVLTGCVKSVPVNVLEGCKIVAVLGDQNSHLDQEGNWLILTNPVRFECRSAGVPGVPSPTHPVSGVRPLVVSLEDLAREQ